LELSVPGSVGLGNLWVKGVHLVWLGVTFPVGLMGGGLWLTLNLEELLVEVELVSLHGDVFTKVLITVHASSELSELLLVLLVEVELVALHSDVLTEVLVTVHTSGEVGLNKVLVEVEFVTLHSDVLTEVLITVHSGGELSKVLVEVEFVTLHGDVLTKILVSVHASSELGLNKVLVEVEFVTLHGDILTKILITVHTSGEKHVTGWCAHDSSDSRLGTSGLNLNETSGSWVSGDSEWWFVEGWWGISSNIGNKSSNGSGIFHFLLIN
jgi:hypothetical protein